MPCGQRILYRELVVPVLPRSACIQKQRHGELETDRKRARPRKPTATEGSLIVVRHLRPYPTLPRRHVLHDNDKRGQRRQLHGDSLQARGTVERAYMAAATRHRPFAIFRKREMLHGEQS